MRKLIFLIPFTAIFVILFVVGTVIRAAIGSSPESGLIYASVIPDSNGPAQELAQARILMRDKQFENAEAIYLKIIYENPGTIEAFEAQKQLIRIAIFEKDQEKADAAFEQFIEEFPDNENIAHIIFQLGCDYNILNRKRAFEIHQFNVSHYPQDKFALWSEVMVIKSYIADGNDLADLETDFMIDLFAEQNELPKAIYKLATWYNRFDNQERALELYNYDIQNYPADVYALWSQFKFDIADGYYITAKEVFNSIVTKFHDYESLPEEIYYAAMELQNADVNELSEMAFDFHQYNVDNYSNYKFWHVMFSQVELTCYFINRENEEGARAEFEILLNIFAKKYGLPAAILAVGDAYWDMGMLKYIGTGFGGTPNETSLEYFAKAIEKYELIINQYNSSPITPEAFFAAAEGYRMFNDSMKAINYYEQIVKNWPDYKKAPLALVKIARTYNNLASRGEIVQSDADVLVKDAYEQLVTYYPNTQEAAEAQDWLNHRNTQKDGLDTDLPENIKRLIERFEK